ncbi:MAG: multiheme c-type cytochrome [Armatimonadota bacterium]
MVIPKPRRTTLLSLALTVCALVGAWAPSGCGKDGPGHGPAIVAATYVGNDACAPCHAKEMRQHKGSRHDTTLHLATEGELGGMMPQAGPIAGAGLSLARSNGSARLEGSGTAEAVPFDLAFGSGKLGLTFVQLLEDGTLVESAQSWIPSKGLWYKTPGQEFQEPGATGFKHSPGSSRMCLECHTITVPKDSLKPERRFFGVGCETCHGPGSAHVEAARAKQTDLRIEDLGRLSAREQNERCGKCHRAFDGIGHGGIEVTMTNRFQAFGLMQSPCFERGGEKISCMTCHDPHADADTNRRNYDLVCLSCHSPGAPTAPPEAPSERAEQVCPKQPATNCTKCHMPERPVFPKSNISTDMADHLIWAYGKQGKGSAKSKDSKR